ncbi:terminase [archaeon]|nr:terminase [archaeon]|tara:strand:- start:115 stop:519 length:405 start_codon:yes stop_codon:yes gene_type:complete
MEDIIAESLGMEPKEKEQIQEIVVTAENIVVNNGDIDNDYNFTRKNLYNIIEKGNEALEDILDVAKASESPRAYEVVSDLLKAIVATNKDLLDLTKKKKELEEVPKDPDEGAGITNNNLFIGSTAELQKLINKV